MHALPFRVKKRKENGFSFRKKEIKRDPLLLDNGQPRSGFLIRLLSASLCVCTFQIFGTRNPISQKNKNRKKKSKGDFSFLPLRDGKSSEGVDP